MEAQNHSLDLGQFSKEFSSARFGDVRLTARLCRVAEALGAKAEQSIPRAVNDSASLEATYRFLGNERVSPWQILEPHVEETLKRIEAEKQVVILHDTTGFSFQGEAEREGLGYINQSKSQKGFMGHFSLAVSRRDLELPLGIVGLTTLTRVAKSSHKRDLNKEIEKKKESERWFEMVEEVEGKISDGVIAIHVMDREADDFKLFSRLIENGWNFVIRLRRDRVVDISERKDQKKRRKLSYVLDRAEHVYEGSIEIAKRKPSQFDKANKLHPPRMARTAKVAFSAASVKLVRPRNLGHDVEETIELNLVRVHEIDCPNGNEPVEWILLTTEPVNTPQQLVEAVEIYRRRWLIEQYFKALKSGCAYEKSQLESYQTLLNALAIYAPIAWRLLLLRALSRTGTNKNVDEVIPKVQIILLRYLYKKRIKKTLPPHLTAHTAMLAIAALGGHIKNNGPPGWQVLGRGYHDLLIALEGWNAAVEAGLGGCDQ